MVSLFAPPLRQRLKNLARPCIQKSTAACRGSCSWSGSNPIKTTGYCSLKSQGYLTAFKKIKSRQGLLVLKECSTELGGPLSVMLLPRSLPKPVEVTRTKRDLFFGSTKLAENNELEILGVTVDCKLTWTEHVSNVAAWEREKLGALHKVAHKLTREEKVTVYKTQVRSVMEYASLCWMSASWSFLTPSKAKCFRLLEWMTNRLSQIWTSRLYTTDA